MDEQTKSQKRTIIWVCVIALSLLMVVKSMVIFPPGISIAISIGIFLPMLLACYLLWWFRKR